VDEYRAEYQTGDRHLIIERTEGFRIVLEELREGGQHTELNLSETEMAVLVNQAVAMS